MFNDFDGPTTGAMKTVTEALQRGKRQALVSEIMETTALVQAELHEAMLKHPTGMRGVHEAYAVILEELDEVWDEVKAKKPDLEKMRKELVQVAAMAVRAIIDLNLRCVRSAI